MAFTDEQKTKRFELENRTHTTLSQAERVLLAALNDLKEADESGKDIKKCEQAVKEAQKAVDTENNPKAKKEVEDLKPVAPGGDDVRRVQDNQ